MTRIPIAERPRERLARVGPRALSLRELVAVLLGSGPRGQGCMGLASAILQAAGADASGEGSIEALGDAIARGHGEPFPGLAGLGPAGRARLAAAFELGRRERLQHEKSRPDPHPLSESPQGATTGRDLDRLARRALAQVSLDLRSSRREWLGFVPITRAGGVGALHVVARGGAGVVTAEPAELFAPLLGLRPAAVVLIHNHPSGHVHATRADQILTRRVRDLATAFGILLLAHWVVAARGVGRVAID